jgi:hypothetical protein
MFGAWQSEGGQRPHPGRQVGDSRFLFSFACATVGQVCREWR